MQLDQRSHNRNHILEILIPFSGLLEPYRIAVLPATAILLLLVVLFHNKGKVYLSKKIWPFVIFVGYTVLRDIFHMFFSVSDPISAQMNRLTEKCLLYALIFMVCGSAFDEKALFRWWKVAGVIFGAGMLYHVFQILVLGQGVQPINLVPGYDISHDPGMTYDRPMSFFSEPSAYVTSMMPLLFLALNQKSFWWAALSTFLIAISTSTVGILLCAVLWLAFIFQEKKTNKSTWLYIGFIGLFAALFFTLPIFSATLEKIQDVSAGESTWGSRVEGPFQVVGAMQWYELPFGTNVLDTIQFVLRNIGKFPKDSAPYLYVASGRDTVYLNTVALLIYRYGIMGLALFLFIFKGKLSKNFGGRLYAIMLLAASLGTESVASPGIQMLLLVLYTCDAGHTDKKGRECLVDDKMGLENQLSMLP